MGLQDRLGLVRRSSRRRLVQAAMHALLQGPAQDNRARGTTFVARGLRRDHRSNANIQQRPIGHSIATRGPGTEAKESKIAGCRAALADVQPLTNRRTKFVVLAFE